MHAVDVLAASTGPFVPQPLPRDADGFVRSFDVDPHSQAADADIKAFFDKYGVVVVRVLDVSKAVALKDDIWAFLERHSGVTRDRPETYHQWPSLGNVGILGNTFIMGAAACDVRQDPAVHAAFRAVFGTPKLHVAVRRCCCVWCCGPLLLPVVVVVVFRSPCCAFTCVVASVAPLGDARKRHAAHTERPHAQTLQSCSGTVEHLRGDGGGSEECG